MERVPDIGFGSYDRLFPSQDSVPMGGFGNLIALPLQGIARSSGNSEFIDESCSPYPDQWAFLSAIGSMPQAKVEHLVEEASASGKILGVRIPLVDEDEEPWLAPASLRQTPPAIREPLPGTITVVQADQIYLPRHALPPSLVARLVRLAAFQNPEFYAAQAMRRSTHNKPRIISCAELTSHHVALPRGCFDAVLDLLTSLGIAVTIEDRRFSGAAIPLAFTGALRSDQETAIAALLPHDTGVLAATTAFGKTILAHPDDGRTRTEFVSPRSPPSVDGSMDREAHSVLKYAARLDRHDRRRSSQTERPD
jgi:hypothetical protein